MKRTLTRTSILLLLALVISSPSFAAGRSLGLQDSAGLFSRVWQFLGPLLPGGDKGTASLDPNGTPTPPSTNGADTTPPEEEGDGTASLDPNG